MLSADRGGITTEHLCHQIHRTLAADFSYALVWGRSGKHYPQRCALLQVLGGCPAPLVPAGVPGPPSCAAAWTSVKPPEAAGCWHHVSCQVLGAPHRHVCACRVGLAHALMDEDVVQINKKKVTGNEEGRGQAAVQKGRPRTDIRPRKKGGAQVIAQAQRARCRAGASGPAVHASFAAVQQLAAQKARTKTLGTFV